MEDAVSVLVLFATVEGQTGRIAKFAARQVKKAGLDVVIANVSDEMATGSITLFWRPRCTNAGVRKILKP